MLHHHSFLQSAHQLCLCSIFDRKKYLKLLIIVVWLFQKLGKNEQRKLNRTSWADTHTEDGALSPTSVGRCPWLFQTHMFWCRRHHKPTCQGNGASWAMNAEIDFRVWLGVMLSSSMSVPPLEMVTTAVCLPACFCSFPCASTDLWAAVQRAESVFS